MKKLFGLLAVAALVACSGEDTVSPLANTDPNTNPNQNAQQQTVNQDSIAQAAAQAAIDSMNAIQQQKDAEQAALQHYQDSVAAYQAQVAAEQAAQQQAAQQQAAQQQAAQQQAAQQQQNPQQPVNNNTNNNTNNNPGNKTNTGANAAAADVDDGTFSLTLWDAAKGNPQVSTGNKTGGWWYDYANSGSEVVWGAELGTDGDKTAVLEACGGICGDYSIGGTAKYPYLGVAFDYDSKGNAADASAMKGVCVTYSFSGDNDFALELGMTQDQEDNLGSALPMVILPAGTKKTMDFAWSEFEQPEWAEVTMKGTNAAKQLKSLKFKIVDPVAGDAGAFTIFKVGPKGSCN